MSVVAIDTNKLFRALKATGKSENFSAEDLVSAFDAARGEGDLVTRTYIDTRLAVFDAKLATMRAEIQLEVKSAQLRNAYWLLIGIILMSNGALIALLGRVARLY